MKGVSNYGFLFESAFGTVVLVMTIIHILFLIVRMKGERGQYLGNEEDTLSEASSPILVDVSILPRDTDDQAPGVREE